LATLLQVKVNKNSEVGLYIHVPFCEAVCHYCDFAVLKAPHRLHRQWLNGVQKEWERMIPPHLQSIGGNPDLVSPHTLYIGGGTPGSLSQDCWKDLAEWLNISLLQNMNHHTSTWKEATVEVNPGNPLTELIPLFQSARIDRVSIGIQSLDDKILLKLGRKHTGFQAMEALQTLTLAGFRVTVDLMFGLPGQSPDGFLQDLERVLEAEPGHVALYGLTIEENTLFSQWQQKSRLSLPEDYDIYYLQAAELLANYGYHRYEVSAFCRPGQESLHNQVYWNGGSWLGLGPGAHSFDALLQRRWENPRSLKHWNEKVSGPADQYRPEFEVLLKAQQNLEQLWLGLRQAKGLQAGTWERGDVFQLSESQQDTASSAPLQDTASSAPLILHPVWLEKYLEQRWLQEDSGCLKLHDRGWLMLDEICVNLSLATGP